MADAMASAKIPTGSGEVTTYPTEAWVPVVPAKREKSVRPGLDHRVDGDTLAGEWYVQDLSDIVASSRG